MLLSKNRYVAHTAQAIHAPSRMLLQSQSGGRFAPKTQVVDEEGLSGLNAQVSRDESRSIPTGP